MVSRNIRRIERVCQNCNKKFLAIAYQVSIGMAKFCCVDCKKQAQKGLYKTSIEKSCEFCEKTFRTLPSRIEKGEGKFCSAECAHLAARRRTEIACPTCGRTFVRKNWEIQRSKEVVACSQKCAFVEMKRLVRERHKNSTEKLCFDCKEIKPLSEFHNASREASGVTVYCKACVGRRSIKYRANQHKKRAITKASLVIKLGNKCSHCGAIDLPICCYDFHHTSDDKEFDISVWLGNPSINIETELAKCILLCRNCHAVHHAKYSNLSATAYL